MKGTIRVLLLAGCFTLVEYCLKSDLEDQKVIKEIIVFKFYSNTLWLLHYELCIHKNVLRPLCRKYNAESDYSVVIMCNVHIST